MRILLLRSSVIFSPHCENCGEVNFDANVKSICKTREEVDISYAEITSVSHFANIICAFEKMLYQFSDKLSQHSSIC